MIFNLFAGLGAALAVAFAFGTVTFWVMLFIAFCIVTAFVENDRGVAAFFVLTVAAVLLLNRHTADLLYFIGHHPGRTAAYILAYFAAGTVWGIVKWFLHVTKKLEEYKEKKARFLRNEHATEITPDLVKGFKSYMGTSYSDGQPPQVHEHKSDIMMWMTYWPFSGLWTLVNDPVRRAFRAIYRSIASSLQSMSDRLFKNAVAEMNQPVPPAPEDNSSHPDYYSGAGVTKVTPGIKVRV
jgi:hypothetical protein